MTDTAPDWRSPDERFGIYVVRDDHPLRLIATCATPEALGVALVTLAFEQEFVGGSVGVLDSHGDGSVPGTWLLNPWEVRWRTRSES